MEQYTIYCTEEQTKKAFELGAPLIQIPSLSIIPDGSENLKAYKYEDNLYLYPTAEQMIGWLEEQGITEVKITTIDDVCSKEWGYCIFDNGVYSVRFDKTYPSRKEATLAAIDDALDYLSKK